MSLNYPLILFDSQCALCTRFKQGLSLLDTKNLLHFESVHDDNLYEELTFLDKQECLDKVHLVDEDRKIYSGSEVIEFLIRYYPGVSKLAWLLDYDISKKSLNIFYEAVDQLRKSSLNRCANCRK